MPAGAGRGGVTIDARQYADLRRRARDFSDVLDRELKKALKNGGKIGADAAKVKILAMPSTGHGYVLGGAGDRSRRQLERHFLRAKLARNIRVQVSSTDVRIVQGVAGISGANAKGLPRRLDAGVPFRHPVMGHEPWVTQMGYSYFARPIAAKRPEIERGIRDAMDRASRVLDGTL